MAENGNREKNGGEHHRMALAVYKNVCPHLSGGMAFYKQCFQGDPARDECPFPYKGIGKKKKKAISNCIIAFHVALLVLLKLKCLFLTPLL